MDLGGLAGNLMGAKKYLDGLDFPASKQQIIAHAKSKDAPGAVVTVLEKLPEKAYESASEVAEKVGLG